MKKKVVLLLVVFLALGWYMAISDMMAAPRKFAEHLDKAAELERKGIYVDAITEYEGALTYKPNDSEIMIKMAQDYLAIDDSSKFTAVLKQAAEMNQEDTKALDMLMQHYLDKDFMQDAVQYIKTFTKSYPENENAKKWYDELKGGYTETYCFYNEMYGMKNDYMIVKNGDYYGMVNAEGSKVLELIYEELHPFSEQGFALTKNSDGNFIYIDTDGQTRIVPDAAYQNLGMLSSDRITASLNGKYGYLDETGEPVTDFAWDAVSSIYDNIGAVKQGEKWALVNADGKEKDTGYIYDDVIGDSYGFCSYQNRIFVKENNAYHLINKKGENVGNLTFENARAFTPDGYAAVSNGSKWGFVDAEGNLVIDYTYDDAQSFSNGYAAVSLNGKWGYIDIGNDIIIDTILTEATPFSSEGTAAVKMPASDEYEGSWKLIRLNISL